MRNRKEVLHDVEAAYKDSRVEWTQAPKYKYDQHTRQELMHRVIVELLLDIRDLLQHEKVSPR
jgi:hypothetical protein